MTCEPSSFIFSPFHKNKELAMRVVIDSPLITTIIYFEKSTDNIWDQFSTRLLNLHPQILEKSTRFYMEIKSPIPP